MRKITNTNKLIKTNVDLIWTHQASSIHKSL